MSLRSFVATAVVGACLAVPLTLVGVAAVSARRQAVSAQIDRGQQLAATAATLRTVALGSGSVADQAVLQQFVRAVVVGDVAFAIVADPRNGVVASGIAPGFGDPALLLAAVPRGVVVVDAAVVERDRQTKAEVPAGRVLVGLVQARLSTQSVAAVAIAGVVVVFFVVALLLWLLEWRLVRPVKAVAAGLVRVAEGDLTADVEAPARDDEVAALVDGFHSLVEALKAKDRLQTSLRSVAGAQVVADPDTLDAPPRQTEVSVLFVDVRDFTPLTRALSPEHTLAFLDRLLSAFVDVVHRHGGHVERFLGDGLVAVWGAPKPCADHAACAVAAAVDIEHRAKVLSRRAKEDGQQPFVVGIGVHSGPAVTGGVGPPTRRYFAVTGEVPALARRVQQEAKSQGLVVLVTEETWEQAKARVVNISWSKTPPILVRGIGLPLSLYRPKKAESVVDTDRISR